MLRLMLAVSLTLLCLTTPAEAQRNCRKGIPCGNTCISRDKVCRVGSSAPTATTPRPLRGPSSAAPRRAVSRTPPPGLCYDSTQVERRARPIALAQMRRSPTMPDSLVGLTFEITYPVDAYGQPVPNGVRYADSAWVPLVDDAVNGVLSGSLYRPAARGGVNVCQYVRRSIAVPWRAADGG